MIVPSYLKPVPGAGAMQVIWSAAHQALTGAARVEVYGFSLPASDSAARALLNVLHARVRDRSVSVVVTDPSRATGQRCSEFLGAEVWREDSLE